MIHKQCVRHVAKTLVKIWTENFVFTKNTLTILEEGLLCSAAAEFTWFCTNDQTRPVQAQNIQRQIFWLGEAG
jgi:hypothetical protein